MSYQDTTKRKHDIAYACFLPPGLFALISGASGFVQMDTGTAGGIGFLVLIPLALASFVSLPIGIYRSVVYRKDTALVILTIATILMLVQMFAEVGPVKVRSLLWLAYGVLVITIEAAWFLQRRRRMYGT